MRAFVRDAARVQNWSEQMEILERAARGEPEFTIAVARAMREGEAIAFVSLRSHARTALALAPGIEQALAAIELAFEAGREHWERISPPRALRSTAAMLAQAQDHDVIVEIAERLEARTDRAEILALLLHEAVLRGIAVTEVPAFVRLARDLRGREHPLSVLPLHRLSIEEDLVRRMYHPRGSSGGWQLHGMELGAEMRAVLESRRRGWRVNETTTNREAIEIRACALSMLEESNGQAEARVFEVSPSAPDDMPALLWSLGLESLRPMTGGLTVTREVSTGAFRALFSIAAQGGAYDVGLEGALARLHAWRSFRALAGAEEGSSLEAAAEHAESCAWFFWAAESPFFANVAWDAGIACLRPDASVAVFAITDTD